MTSRRLLVLYGSETGTAQDVAERVAREGKRRYFNVSCLPLDHYNVAGMLQETLAVFVVSTTGQGDPPENMKQFWRFIMRRSLPSSSLIDMNYAVLGLGDSSYQKFNFIGKKLHKRLQQLGASPLQRLGLGDDQHDLGADAVIGPWIEALWQHILRLQPVPHGLDIIPDTQLSPSKYKVVVLDEPRSDISLRLPSPTAPHPASPCQPVYAKLVDNARVTAEDHWQDVRLIRLQNDRRLSYSPGDVLMIQPENSERIVTEILKLLCLNPDDQFILQQNDPDVPLPPTLPQPCTFRHLFTSYLDIAGTPKRYFWELLGHFSSSELEKEKCTEFVSAEGQQDLYDYCHRPRRHITEILGDFPHATAGIRLDYIFDLISPLQPRAFSIASSNEASPDEIQLLVAVVKYRSKLVEPRRGVCSTWLADLNPSTGPELAVWVRPGTLTFPADINTPIIMIGPGTGVAPFRSFVQERAAKGGKGCVLFFGCRNRDKDYFFKDDWSRLEQQGVLKCFTAFSRDQEDKVYVQHRIMEQGALVWDLIENHGAHVYLAGNSKRMPDDVREALRDAFVEHGGKTKMEAEDYLQQLDKCKRYQAETWS